MVEKLSAKAGQEPAWKKHFFEVAIGVSFGIHIVLAIIILVFQQPPQQTSQSEYAEWLKKLSPREIVWQPEPTAEEKPKEEKKPDEEKGEEAVAKGKSKGAEKQEVAEAKPAPDAAQAQAQRRGELRAKLAGKGILNIVAAMSDEGGGVEDLVGKNKGKGTVVAGAQAVQLGRRDLAVPQNIAGPPGGDKVVDLGGGSVHGASGKARTSIQPFKESDVVAAKGGRIDEGAVRRAIARRNAGIQQCYERALKDPSRSSGKVLVRLSIDSEGKVVKAEVVEDSLGLADVVECTLSILKRTRFPQTDGGIVSITVPLFFQPAD